MPIEISNDLLGAAINLLIALVIVRFIYYPASPDKNFVFTFLAFNTVIYFVVGLLTSVEIGIGVGFGLFAIFSVLRYRTAEITPREMTYLFVLIALPVMNSILAADGAFSRLLVSNGIVMVLLFVLEREWGFRFESSKRVTYEKIELVTPARRAELLADLRERTGLPVTQVRVGSVDFSKDVAELRIFYTEPKI